MGAGRSEILGALFGKQTKGVRKSVSIRGKEVAIRGPVDAINAGMGFVTEERKLDSIILMLTILENLILPSLKELPGRLFLNRETAKRKANEISTALNIKAPSLKTMLVNLSGGNQQKVVIGKWMMKRPKIFLIDEPTKGIDVGAKAEIYKFLGDLASQGAAIVLVSSDMPELVNMSDRCLVINNGRISAELVGAEITDETVMKAAM